MMDRRSMLGAGMSAAGAVAAAVCPPISVPTPSGLKGLKVFITNTTYPKMVMVSERLNNRLLELDADCEVAFTTLAILEDVRERIAGVDFDSLSTSDDWERWFSGRHMEIVKELKAKYKNEVSTYSWCIETALCVFQYKGEEIKF